MNLPVGLRIASFFGYPSRKKNDTYEIIVKDLAFEKKVSLWVEKKDCWSDIFAEYKESLPGGFEKWIIETSEKFHKFAVKYQVNGSTYWDNNGGIDYSIPKFSEDSFVLTGCEFPIVHGDSFYSQHKLYVYSAVQKSSSHKDVDLVYTTDSWKNYNTISARHHWTQKSGIEIWKFDHSIVTSSDIEFALFCKMDGKEYWDNNFYRNYIEKTSHSIMGKKAGLEISGNELWEIPMQKEISEKPKKILETETVSNSDISEPELIKVT